MTARWKRRWRWPARLLAVGGSCLALGLVFRRLDVAALRVEFATLKLGWYLLGQSVFALGLLAAGIRWHLMLRLNHEAVVHGGASVRMVFISQFFTTAFGGPSGGDVPKTAVYSRWFGVPASDVVAASVLDRSVASVGGLVFATAAVCLGASFGAFEFLRGWEWRVPGPWVWGVILAAVVLVAGVGLWGFRCPDSFVGRALRSFRDSARKLLSSRRRSAQALVCAVVTAVLFNFTQIACLQAVSPDPIAWWKLLWLYHVVTAVAALPITVAGTGLREGASMVLLAQYGIPASTAVAAAMLTLSIHVTWAAVGIGMLTWEQRRRRRAPCRTAPKSISVVVPVLNEEESISETLRRLKQVPEVTEIIVVDGGSDDGTVGVAEREGCRVVRSVRGRGTQLREGARGARGDVVWLVHADTWVEPGSGGAIFRCLRDPLVVGGGFWKRFVDAPWMIRGSRLRCWLRLAWSRRVFGDQALFVRREVLERVGGIPDQVLMEDVELCERLGREGRLALAGAPVATSTRRFRKHGIVGTYWRMWRVLRGYRRGVPPEELLRWYERK